MNISTNEETDLECSNEGREGKREREKRKSNRKKYFSLFNKGTSHLKKGTSLLKKEFRLDGFEAKLIHQSKSLGTL